MSDITLREDEKRILDFLTENHPKDYTIPEIAEALNLERSTTHNHILFLKRIGRIIHSRTIQKTKCYTINPEN